MNICSEQDCGKDTGNPAFILCSFHYQQYRNGNLNPCPAHPATYKPTKYPTCRQCIQPRTNGARQTAKPTGICAERGCQNRLANPQWRLCEVHWEEYKKGYPNRKNPKEICSRQGCRTPTGPGYRLCHVHWLENVSNPAQQANVQQTRTSGHQPQDADRGWNRQPASQTHPIRQQTVEAVKLVRRNMTDHLRDCTNHETNTIQFLVMPLLAGLGWNEHDPQQVIREHKPDGPQPYELSQAVDIALLHEGEPKVFIEVKRLDRTYIPEYGKQLDRYASYLKKGTAILTNGQHWQIYTVADGRTSHLLTVDIADGDPETPADQMVKILGKQSVPSTTGNTPSVRTTSPRETEPPEAEGLMGKLKNLFGLGKQ